MEETDRMPASDARFAYGHARDYAGGSGERAEAYAEWYERNYITSATSIDDLPAHPHVWGRFLDSLQADNRCATCHRDAHRPGAENFSHHGHPYKAPEAEAQ